MVSIQKLEKEIELLKIRNQRVKLDKRWESSFARRFLIAIFTFLSIGIYLWVINVEKPWFNAIIPTIGFTLSTLSLPWFKEIWQKIHHWLEERDVLNAIRIGEAEEKAGKLKVLSKDLHELLE